MIRSDGVTIPEPNAMRKATVAYASRDSSLAIMLRPCACFATNAIALAPDPFVPASSLISFLPARKSREIDRVIIIWCPLTPLVAIS